MKSTRWIPTAALVVLAACQPAAEEALPQADAAAAAAARAAINEANARAATAMNARDRAAYLDVFGAEATLMDVAAPDIVGRAAYDASLGPSWEAMRDSGVVLTWQADSIEVHGDFAYEVGHGMRVRSRPGAARDTSRTRYITFWRKDPDGAWRVWRDFTVRVPRPGA